MPQVNIEMLHATLSKWVTADQALMPGACETGLNHSTSTAYAGERLAKNLRQGQLNDGCPFAIFEGLAAQAFERARFSPLQLIFGAGDSVWIVDEVLK